MNWQGEYSTLTAYLVDDAVSYNGSSYLCILASSGNLPTNTTYWSILAEKGLDGDGAGDMVKAIYDADDNGIVDNAEALNSQAGSYYLSRTNHTGTQTASTISDFDTEVSNNTDVAANTTVRHTHSNKTALDAVSGTNTGNETATSIGALINGSTEKVTPVDNDMVGLMDSAASNILKKLSWSNIKSALKTYFDTIYTAGKLLVNGNGYALDNGSTRPTLGTKAVDLSYTGILRSGATGDLSYAEGEDTLASGFCSHAGGMYCMASGDYSHADGSNSVASGDYSHAEGYLTEASEECSHVEGNYTQASGYYSHAEGSGSIASGGASHAEGSGSIASGGTSHAEGEDSDASGEYSHAEGNSSVASGYISHAQNAGTIAQGYAQTAIGEFNIAQGTGGSRIDSDHAFIIGNGTDDANRSNALTVDWSGNLAASGNITEGGTALSSKYLAKSGGTMTGILTAQSNTSYTTKQARNIIISTSDPTLSSMANGDIWIKV